MMKITYAGGNTAGEASHLAVQEFSSTEILTAKTISRGKRNEDTVKSDTQSLPAWSLSKTGAK